VCNAGDLWVLQNVQVCDLRTVWEDFSNGNQIRRLEANIHEVEAFQVSELRQILSQKTK
jgi:hypothetical protein